MMAYPPSLSSLHQKGLSGQIPFCYSPARSPKLLRKRTNLVGIRLVPRLHLRMATLTVPGPSSLSAASSRTNLKLFPEDSL